MNRLHQRLLLALLVVAVCQFACMKSYAPVRDTYYQVTADAQARSARAASGVTIDVEPIAVPDYITRIPDYCAPTSVAVCLPEQETGPVRVDWQIGPYGNVKNPYIATGCAPLVDLAFVIQIRNGTSHSLDLGSAVMQLESSDGTVYEPIHETGHCSCRARTIENRTENPSAWPGPIRVLPGKYRETFASFCFGCRAARFPMSLLVYDVPVETDAAGTVTRRENFTFAIEGGHIERFLAFTRDGKRATWSEKAPLCGRDQFAQSRQPRFVPFPVPRRAQPRPTPPSAVPDSVQAQQTNSGVSPSAEAPADPCPPSVMKLGSAPAIARTLQRLGFCVGRPVRVTMNDDSNRIGILEQVSSDHFRLTTSSGTIQVNPFEIREVLIGSAR